MNQKLKKILYIPDGFQIRFEKSHHLMKRAANHDPNWKSFWESLFMSVFTLYIKRSMKIYRASITEYWNQLIGMVMYKSVLKFMIKIQISFHPISNKLNATNRKEWVIDQWAKKFSNNFALNKSLFIKWWPCKKLFKWMKSSSSHSSSRFFFNFATR